MGERHLVNVRLDDQMYSRFIDEEIYNSHLHGLAARAATSRTYHRADSGLRD